MIMALAGTACTPSQEEKSTAVERSEAVGAPAPVILRPAELFTHVSDEAVELLEVADAVSREDGPRHRSEDGF